MSVEHAHGHDFERHLHGKDESEDVVGNGEEVALDGVGWNEGPLHGQSDAVQADEEENDMVEPALGHEIVTSAPEAFVY